MAGGVEEADVQLVRFPAGFPPQTGHQEAIRALVASSGRPAATEHATHLIELLYVYIFIL